MSTSTEKGIFMKNAIRNALVRAGMTYSIESLEPTLMRENLLLDDIVEIVAQAILEDLHQEVVSSSVKVWWS
ncbi:MAG: hypothetical protein EBU84_05585 [Actinobacteria bacterium]|nr:hypothetical protein [Actinomycetota bacterium]